MMIRPRNQDVHRLSFPRPATVKLQPGRRYEPFAAFQKSRSAASRKKQTMVPPRKDLFQVLGVSTQIGCHECNHETSKERSLVLPTLLAAGGPC